MECWSVDTVGVFLGGYVGVFYEYIEHASVTLPLNANAVAVSKALTANVSRL